MCAIDLTIPVLQAHGVGIPTVDSSVASPRAVMAKSDTEAVVDRMPDFTAPHAFFGVAGAFFGNSVADRSADLLDPRSRKGGGDVK